MCRRSFLYCVCVWHLTGIVTPTRILKASEAGHTESYIICPAAVVGPTTGPAPASSVFFFFNSQFVLAMKKPVYVGEGENVFHAVRVHFNHQGICSPPCPIIPQVCLDDLVDLYRRIFARILSRQDAEASPYSRYYIAVSTPLQWKHIMTVFGSVLDRSGKLDDGIPQSIPSADTLPPPCVCDPSFLSRFSILPTITMLMMRLLFLLLGHRCSSVPVNTFAENVPRIWVGSHGRWC